MSALKGNATWSRSRSAVLAGTAALVVGGALAAGLLAGGSGSNHSDGPSTWPQVGLASSFVTSAGSWAIVPMGELSAPTNTFWQIFFRPDGKADWLLVTPPGVAANGGLAADVGEDGRVTAVFDPTNRLTFSPFATTADNGTKWTGGVIPFGVAPVPDALIAPPSQSGQLFALNRGGQAIEAGAGAEPQWSVVYTRTELARSSAGQKCHISALTALAGVGGDRLVGSACTTPGIVGIFRAPAGATNTWQLVGPTLDTGSEFEVLRLSATGGRLVALADGRKGAINNLFGMWAGPQGSGSQGSGWSESAPLVVGTGARIVSSGFGPDSSLVVETKSSGGSLRAAVLNAGAGASWQDLPPLPAGTQSVSIGAGESTTALSVGLTRFTAWKLENRAWVRTQGMDVPIQFGSSG